jgi:hypothetical protein
MITQPTPQLPPDRPPRESLQETSLSMGPRGGTADSYNRTLREARARATDALNSHPLTRPSRSFSAPVNTPEPAPQILPFDLGLPSINIMPTTPASSRRARTAEGRDARSPSPITPPPNIQQPPLRRSQPTLQGSDVPCCITGAGAAAEIICYGGYCWEIGAARCGGGGEGKVGREGE